MAHREEPVRVDTVDMPEVIMRVTAKLFIFMSEGKMVGMEEVLGMEEHRMLVEV